MNGIANYSSTRRSRRRPVQQSSGLGAGSPGGTPIRQASAYGAGTGTPTAFKPTATQASTFAGVTAGSALLSDPTYLAAQDQGARQTAVADATAQYQQNQLQSAYGFDANGGIDPNNPYSRAALLQESYKRARLGNTNSYAAQGQLYSGAQQTAQDESTRQYNIGYDTLAKGYQADQGNVLLNQLAAYGNASGGVNSAAMAALLAKLNGGS